MKTISKNSGKVMRGNSIAPRARVAVVALAIIAGVVASPPAAHAQSEYSSAELAARITALEKSIAELRRFIEEKAAVLSKPGGIEARLLILENQVKALAETGKIAPEGRGTGETPQSSLQTQENPNPTVNLDTDTLAVEVLPPGTPDEQYEFARRAVLQNDFDTAEQAFREFIDRYPDNGNLANAYYFLGKVLFIKKDYREAVKTFVKFSDEWPDDRRRNETALLIGESALNFPELDIATPEQACAILDQLSTAASDPDDETFKSRLADLKARGECAP